MCKSGDRPARNQTLRLSREEPEMLRNVAALLAFCSLFSAGLRAAEIKGRIVDPSGAPVAGAQIAAVNRLGVIIRTTASLTGGFQLDAPETPDTRIVVTAAGFSTRTLPPAETATVQLEIAPQVDSV